GRTCPAWSAPVARLARLAPPVVRFPRIPGVHLVVGALRPLDRQRQPVYQIGDDRVGGTPAHLCLGGRDDPVREHRDGEVLQVVREHVVTPVEGGDRAGGADQLEGGPGRGAQAQLRRLAGGGDQVDRVLLDGLGTVHVADGGDQP